MADLIDTNKLAGGDKPFAAIMKVQKAAEPSISFAGGVLPRASISEQVSNRILAMMALSD